MMADPRLMNKREPEHANDRTLRSCAQDSWRGVSILSAVVALGAQRRDRMP